MKTTLTVSDIRNLKNKVKQSNPESDRYYVHQLTEIVELLFLENLNQGKRIEALTKEVKKAERNLTIKINALSSRK